MKKINLTLFSTLAVVVVVVSVTLTRTGSSPKRPQFVPYALGSSLLAGDQGSGIQLVTPPQLPSSDGIQLGAGWTLAGSGEASMYIAPSSSSSGSSSTTAAASNVGLQGGLNQIWTLTAAISQYGTLGNGLELPLPESFTSSNPGPNEVLLTTYQFSGTDDAQNLYLTPGFSNVATTLQDFTPVPGMTSEYSNATAYDDTTLPNQIEYIFQWATPAYWVNLDVIGDSSMSFSQAAQIANLASSSPLGSTTTASSSSQGAGSGPSAPIQLPWSSETS
jgi:hypothetical protein